jgi:antitoxin component of RelBE/YafQ-DinJ toxin-antitoxin module
MEVLMAQLRLEITDDLKDEIQVWADKYGISLAAAVRILLRTGLDADSSG